MNKWLATLIFGLVSSFLAYSQTDPYKGFRKPSMQAGINGSQIDGDKVGGYNQPGFVGGFSAEIGFTKEASLLLEVLYSQKGVRVLTEQVEANISPYFNIRLGYASFAILLNYQLRERLFIQGGPSFNAIVRAKKEVGNSGFVDAMDGYQTIDYCGELGLSYRLLDKLYASGRFIYSLVPMNKQPIIELPNRSGAAFNHTLSFRLHYYFSTLE